MRGRIGLGVTGFPGGPIGVHPFEMHWVDGIFLALKPVAGNFRETDLYEAIAPLKRFIIGHKRCGIRSEIRPNQSAFDLYRIRLDPDFVLEATFDVVGFFEWLRHARAGMVEQPALIAAA